MGEHLSLRQNINDQPTDFERLFALYQQATQTDAEIVTLDSSAVKFMGQNAVAFLGGMIRMLSYQGKEVEWVPSRAAIVRESLQKTGFSATIFAEPAYYGTVAAVKYREDHVYNATAIGAYMDGDWLRESWISLGTTLRRRIIGNMHEIYSNAFTHAQSPIGVMSCGQYFPKRQQLALTVADFGVGIPANVRNYLGSAAMSDEDALRWALADGHTTRVAEDVSRGLGLGILRDLVQVNQGELRIFSGVAHACIDQHDTRVACLQQGFCGTIVNIILNCNGVPYLLADEESGDTSNGTNIDVW